LQFEKKRRKTKSKEDNRSLISSQHLQVKKSWENPGLYAWGSNTGKVVAPESNEAFIKTPRRLSWFDNKLLRDVKLDKNFGAAIDERGDLLQWGTGYAKDISEPVVTLKGKNLIQLGISRDRILGLSDNGTVYSVPVSKADQTNGPKRAEGSWIPFVTSDSEISYRTIRPNNLGFWEKVTSIAVGLEHALLATNGWRVYAAAAATQDFPDRGQMGIPGLTWESRPAGPFDQPHEIITLRDWIVTGVAAGDYHSLILDRTGRAASFGDNSSGQLGIGSDESFTAIPHDIPFATLYKGSGQVFKATGIAAGGSNSFFMTEATRLAAQKDDPSTSRFIGRVSSDTWACGSGIAGALGNGRWTHVQRLPTKIPALSELFEYDEKENKVIPIGLSRLSVGSTHVAAVLDNVTHLQADERSSENDTNWGADIVFFGGNDSYQLGTGKRNNLATPTYIQPLDQAAEREVRGKEKHRFHITPRATITLYLLVQLCHGWMTLHYRGVNLSC
jgi:alpha-tubulin suppressor-like RCC1 family protein